MEVAMRALTLALFTVFCLLVASPSAHAQIFQCPSGTTQVAGGGGIMCQCPDGSYYGVYSGCPVQQQQYPQCPPPAPTPRWVLNQNLATTQAYNEVTKRWEDRRVYKVMLSTYQLMYQMPGYMGLAYVKYGNLGWIEIDPERYSREIYPLLRKGTKESLKEAEDILRQLATAEGVPFDTQSE